jgi:hypothetical protein
MILCAGGPIGLGTFRRAARGRSTAARAVRGLALCLLVLLTSGALPVASTCLEDVRDCGDKCRYCACKRRSASAKMRAPCPCCQPHAGAQDPLTNLRPAVVPVPAISFEPPAIPETPKRLAGDELSFAPAIPHPPPRTPALV